MLGELPAKMAGQLAKLLASLAISLDGRNHQTPKEFTAQNEMATWRRCPPKVCNAIALRIFGKILKL